MYICIYVYVYICKGLNIIAFWSDRRLAFGPYRSQIWVRGLKALGLRVSLPKRLVGLLGATVAAH